MDLQHPPDEDSPDLTDEEVTAAIPATNPDDFHQLASKASLEMTAGVAGKVKGGLHFELRRRKPDYYCRVRFANEGEPVKVQVFRMDWLKGL